MKLHKYARQLASAWAYDMLDELTQNVTKWPFKPEDAPTWFADQLRSLNWHSGQRYHTLWHVTPEGEMKIQLRKAN